MNVRARDAREAEEDRVADCTAGSGQHGLDGTQQLNPTEKGKGTEKGLDPYPNGIRRAGYDRKYAYEESNGQLLHGESGINALYSYWQVVLVTMVL